MDVLHAKYSALLEALRGYGKVAVAFSGGVDSTFLLFAAREAVGEHATALTACAPVFPKRELREAQTFCESLKVRQVVVEPELLQLEAVANNTPDRCYHCKMRLFSTMLELIDEQGLGTLVDGSNTDDLDDYRPGRRALAELDVASPLLGAGLSKDEIRALSRELGLPTWNKPSFACLASRIPYGDKVTAALLGMVDQAELALMEEGFAQVRVRVHSSMARIEVPADRVPELVEPGFRERASAKLKELGFSHVAVDLDGYRTGSMNIGVDA